MRAITDKSKRLPAAWCGRRSRPRQAPALRFSPRAWAKLIYFRDRAPTEVGGLGLAPPDDPLLVEDLRLVRQACTPAGVLLDDEALADFCDEQVELGRMPEQFFRVWIHTHLGHSPRPGPRDEETFARLCGSSAWAVMFILARGGRCCGRLQFSAGPGGALLLPVHVDFTRPFGGTDELAWEDEYLQAACLQQRRLPQAAQQGLPQPEPDPAADWQWYERDMPEGDAADWE